MWKGAILAMGKDWPDVIYVKDLFFALERLTGTVEKKLDTFEDIIYALWK